MKVDLLEREVKALLQLLLATNPFDDEKTRFSLRDKLQAALVKRQNERAAANPKKPRDSVTWEQWKSFFDEVPGLINWDITTPEVAKLQYWRVPWRKQFMFRVRDVFAATRCVYTPYDVLIRTIKTPDQLEYLAKCYGKGTRPLIL